MKDNTAWMADAGWGVLIHWLGQQGVSAEDALKKGMQQKSIEFVKQGGKIYNNA